MILSILFSFAILALAEADSPQSDTCPSVIVRPVQSAETVQFGNPKQILPGHYRFYAVHKSTGIMAAFLSRPERYAVQNMFHVIDNMCQQPREICAELGRKGLLIVLLKSDELVTQLPEADAFDNYRAVFQLPSQGLRSYSMIINDLPTLMNSSSADYPYNVFIHEFAHAVDSIIMANPKYRAMNTRIENAFTRLSGRKDIFPNSYIRTNRFEMFADATFIYMNAKRGFDDIDNRDAMKTRARFLHDIVRDVFGDGEFKAFCKKNNRELY